MSKVQRSRCREQDPKCEASSAQEEDRLAKVVVGWQHSWDHLSTVLKMCSVKMWLACTNSKHFTNSVAISSTALTQKLKLVKIQHMLVCYTMFSER